MDKEEIINTLHNNYSEFSNFILSLNEEEYLFSFNNEKWNAGQHNKHLILSTKPVAFALLLPGWLLKIFFGKSNRPSKTYKGLLKKYHSRLKLGGKASKPFTPKIIKYSQKESLSFQLLTIAQTIILRLKTYSESQLEELILPHPLLGKVTLKEMMYFTMYHAVHHLELVKKYLKLRELDYSENVEN